MSRRRLLRLASAAVVLAAPCVGLSLFIEQTAQAATLTVTNCLDDGSAGSLRQTVADASAGATIVFGTTCPPNTTPITLSSSLGPIDINKNLNIMGPGANALAVSENGPSRIFQIDSGVTVTLAGITVENGNSLDGGSGGINNNGTLALNNAVLSGNQTNGSGGAVFNVGTLVVNDSTLSNNSSSVAGGAIFNDDGSLTVTDSLLTADTVTSSGGGGGGIFNYMGTLVVTDSTFSNDRAPAYGGGAIWNHSGTVLMSNSTLSANTADGGGGIWNDLGTTSLSNSTLSANSGTLDGGGGIYNSNGTVNIEATILANSPGGNCYGTFADNGYNLDDDGTCGFTGTSLSDTPADLDPNGLQNNGGPTPTIALEEGSPAIDHIDDPSFCPPTDQRGAERTLPCDIGAYDSAGLSQSLSFTSVAPSGAVVGGPTYMPAAIASSGLTPTLSVDLSSSSICSISAGVVSFQSSGTCTIDANQSGNSNYQAAPEMQQSFSVGPGSQTIVFSSTAPSGAVVGGPTYAVSATGGPSGNPVNFSIDASAISVCSLSGSTVSFIGAGTCVIDANQSGNANYAASAQTQQIFGVAKGSQSITFTSNPPSNALVGGPGYTVSASGGDSGNAVVFAVDPSTASVCSLSGSVVSTLTVGTCTIDANQNGNSNYAPASQVQQSFVVGQGSQLITFTSTVPSDATVDGTPYDVTAIGGASGNPVVIAADASSASVCNTVSGGLVYFVGVGQCTLDANQQGNTNYLAAPETQQSFEVSGIPQSISFASTAPSDAFFGGPNYTVAATGGASGNPVTFSIDASSASVCSISSSVVSFIGTGTCTIKANQAGNLQYAAAPQMSQVFTVSAAPQTINFTSTAPTIAIVAGPTYAVTATGGASGNPVLITVDASSASVCTVSDGEIYFVSAGLCTLDANQQGNSNFLPAPQAQQSFNVGPISQVIRFASVPPSGAFVGGPSYTVVATGGTSGNPVTFSIDSSAASVCSISGSVVNFIGTGSCVIDANQLGNSEYTAAPEMQQIFSVNPAPPCGPSVTHCFTSAASTTVPAGSSFSFTVRTAGTPPAKINGKGKLPKGVKFHTGTGTAIISGTPTSTGHKSALGSYSVTITATFGTGKTKEVVTQTFALTVT